MKYFQLWELVDRVTYYSLGERAWGLLTPDLLHSLDGLRDFLGCPVSINNWWNNTSSYARQYCGYRPHDCPTGAKFSEHKKGNAADCHIKGADYDDLRLHIMASKDDERLAKIMRMEVDVNWLHIDCKQVENRIRLFKP